MISIDINGKQVGLHFGMWFTEAFGKALTAIDPFTSIDFATEGIYAAHVNYTKAFGGVLSAHKSDVFAWVEQSYKDEAKAAELAKFVEAYNESDFAKALAKFNESQQVATDDSKKKAVGKKLKHTRSGFVD